MRLKSGFGGDSYNREEERQEKDETHLLNLYLHKEPLRL